MFVVEDGKTRLRRLPQLIDVARSVFGIDGEGALNQTIQGVGQLRTQRTDARSRPAGDAFEHRRQAVRGPRHRLEMFASGYAYDDSGLEAHRPDDTGPSHG